MSRPQECPECGASVKRENVERHRRNVHDAAKGESEVRREERAVERAKVHARRARATSSRRALGPVLILSAVAVAVGCAVVLGPGLVGPPAEPGRPDPTSECVTHAGLGIHWHVTLKIFVGGMEQRIPANIGVTPGCMRPLHTHDDSGVIHIEWRSAHHFTLGEFFDVWGEPFGSDGLLGRKGPVTMSVDGSSSTAFRSQPLTDGTRIMLSIG
jgi:hypothetical protein